MQDEINEKVIALSIRTTKLTAEILQKSIRFMLSQIKKKTFHLLGFSFIVTAPP